MIKKRRKVLLRSSFILHQEPRARKKLMKSVSKFQVETPRAEIRFLRGKNFVYEGTVLRVLAEALLREERKLQKDNKWHIRDLPCRSGLL